MDLRRPREWSVSCGSGLATHRPCQRSVTFLVLPFSDIWRWSVLALLWMLMTFPNDLQHPLGTTLVSDSFGFWSTAVLHVEHLSRGLFSKTYFVSACGTFTCQRIRTSLFPFLPLVPSLFKFSGNNVMFVIKVTLHFFIN